MDKESVIHTVTTAISAILADQPEHFLVEVKIKPTNNIKVYIDGDGGVGIDDLVKYNRSLYKVLEDKALFPEGDYSLEVSSAGLDEPLKMQRQYQKNIGRDVEVTLLEGSKIEGRLLQVSDNEISVEEKKGKGKKMETINHTFSFSGIKATHVLIKF